MPLTLLPAPGTETRLDRLLKLIPTEVIAVYPTVLALCGLSAWPYAEPIVAALGIVAVVVVLRRDGAATQLQPTARQHVLRCIVFVAWTLVVGNPLEPLAISAEHAHVFGAVGATFIPLLGYLTLAPTSPE